MHLMALKNSLTFEEFFTEKQIIVKVTGKPEYMLAEVKKRCLQVFDACDSSESFPGNGLDLVLAEVSAHGEVTCQKPKTHLINSAQIITNIRGEQVLGVEGGGGG